MGCGSSKAVVAVAPEAAPPKPADEAPKQTLDPVRQQVVVKTVSPVPPSPMHTQKSNSEGRLREENNNIADTLTRSMENMRTNSLDSLRSSKTSLRSKRTPIKSPLAISDLQGLEQQQHPPREKSATSVHSSDSGVFDEGGKDDVNSLRSAGSSRSGSLKPLSGSRSSARQKILRIQSDISCNSHENLNDSLEGLSVDGGMSVVSRPKSRFGNVAFDVLMDAPDTNNTKKRPEKLAKLEIRRRSSKKKTKADIEKKMLEAEERRKAQELEKQMKAKQMIRQYHSHTPVEPFEGEAEPDSSAMESKDIIRVRSNQDGISNSDGDHIGDSLIGDVTGPVVGHDQQEVSYAS